MARSVFIAQNAMRGLRPLLLICALAIIGNSGCRTAGGIRIDSIDFAGVEQVSEGALADALQTKESSRLPWGRKRYFDRRAFEADLKRIEAFYRDRGFPDARVRSFDLRLNEAQDQTDVTLDISEGEPIRVAAIELAGFDVVPDDAAEPLRETMPLRPGRPLDRQLAAAARERAVNVLRDHGYPYAEVTLNEVETGPRQRRLVLEAMPGALAHFGDVEIVGLTSVDERVIRRQLTFEPGDLYTQRALRETQRQLYGLELLEFVNVEAGGDPQQQQQPAVPVRITVAEGRHQKVTAGLGYGSEERARARGCAGTT